MVWPLPYLNLDSASVSNSKLSRSLSANIRSSPNQTIGTHVNRGKLFSFMGIDSAAGHQRSIFILSSVVDPKLFFSDPDPTFQEISDPDPISDPT